MPPVIEDSHVIKAVAVIVGNTARLKCPAEGIPTPKITWKRNNRDLSVYTNPNLRLRDEHMTLEIVTAQRSDAGAYSCVASNNAGETTKEFELNVRGELNTCQLMSSLNLSDVLNCSTSCSVPPSIEEGPEEMAVNLGSSVVLACDSYGVPDPEVGTLTKPSPCIVRVWNSVFHVGV